MCNPDFRWTSLSLQQRLVRARKWFRPIALAIPDCKIRISKSTGKPFLVVQTGAQLASISWKKGDTFIMHYPYRSSNTGEKLTDANMVIARLKQIRKAWGVYE